MTIPPAMVVDLKAELRTHTATCQSMRLEQRFGHAGMIVSLATICPVLLTADFATTDMWSAAPVLPVSFPWDSYGQRLS